LAWVTAPDDWTWAQCDVGQGDAVIVRDGDMVAVFDTGRTETPMRECLATLGIGRIDLLVLTHFDADHAGGYRAVLGRVGTVLHGPTDGVEDEDILRNFVENGTELVPVQRGASGRLGRLEWRVLWPSTTEPREPGNPSSVTLMVTPGQGCDNTCLSGLNLGDLPAVEQRRLLALGGIVPVDIVKVSHHGSRDQEPELYRRVRAPVALIGVGGDNEYGHPTVKILDVLAGTGSTVLRSDINGIVLVSRSQAGELRVWRERQSEPRFTLKAEE
jgi:competence protein ComEC